MVRACSLIGSLYDSRAPAPRVMCRARTDKLRFESPRAFAASRSRCEPNVRGVFGATADDGDQPVWPPLHVRRGRASVRRRRLPDLSWAGHERPCHLRRVTMWPSESHQHQRTLVRSTNARPSPKWHCLRCSGRINLKLIRPGPFDKTVCLKGIIKADS